MFFSALREKRGLIQLPHRAIQAAEITENNQVIRLYLHTMQIYRFGLGQKSLATIQGRKITPPITLPLIELERFTQMQECILDIARGSQLHTAIAVVLRARQPIGNKPLLIAFIVTLHVQVNNDLFVAQFYLGVNVTQK